MIDMVEARVIAGQIAEHLRGKSIAAAEIQVRRKGSMRDDHLLQVKPEKFRSSLEGRAIADAYGRYRHICVETDGEFGLDLWDVYGKILYIQNGAKVPGNPPISLCFADGSRLIVLPGVWGELRLRAVAELRTFREAEDAGLLEIPSEAFTVEALQQFFAHEEFQKSHVKEALTRYYRPSVVSVMGSLGQEALYRAHIHPKRKVRGLAEDEVAALHRAMQAVVREAIAAGGRVSERDLFDKPGGFVPTVSKATAGTPCPACGTVIEGIKMGGAGLYYICPGCQAL
jgi:formamidopyrimidine-DNA glycosylase